MVLSDFAAGMIFQRLEITTQALSPDQRAADA
jgi:hypothetical protein